MFTYNSPDEHTGAVTYGGYSTNIVVNENFVLRVQDNIDLAATAPLLCAGLIGYRSYRLSGDGRRIGLYGFGAAAHIIAQLAVHEGREVFAFTSPGDVDAQQFARALGEPKGSVRKPARPQSRSSHDG